TGIARVGDEDARLVEVSAECQPSRKDGSERWEARVFGDELFDRGAQLIEAVDREDDLRQLGAVDHERVGLADLRAERERLVREVLSVSESVVDVASNRVMPQSVPTESGLADPLACLVLYLDHAIPELHVESLGGRAPREATDEEA